MYNTLSMEAYGNDEDLDEKDKKAQRRKVLAQTNKKVDLTNGTESVIEKWCDEKISLYIDNYLTHALQ